MDSFRFKTITLSGKLITVDSSNNLYVDGNLIGGLSTASGDLLWNRDESLSGSLNDTGSYLLSQISASSAGVNTIGGLSGAVGITGDGGIITSIDGNTIHISGDFVSAGETGSFITQANLNATGLLLWNRDEALGQNIVDLSGQLANYVQTGETGQFASDADIIGLTANLNETGLSNWNRDLNLSNNLALVSGDLVNSSGNLLLRINSISAGQTILNNLSGSIQLTGAGSIQVLNNGQIITVSGSAGGGGAGDVVSINGITGLIQLTGSGNVSVLADGTTFRIGGTFVTPDQTGDFLDPTDAATFVLKADTGQFASDIDISILTTNLGQTGQDLWLRDEGLSDNFIALSGIVAFSSETGDLLDLASQTALELRDTNLSANVSTLSGNVVFKSETGGFLDLASQTSLEARDAELSNNIASLSGVTVFSSETGGFLDLASQTALELRDTNLSANLVTLSGDLGSTGLFLYARDTGLSVNLAAISGLIAASSAGVGAINSESGILIFNGANGVTVTNVGDTFTFSGSLSVIQSLSGSLDSSGLILFNRDSELSNNVASLSGITVTTSDTGTLLDSANLTDLEARDTELSNNVATLSGNIVLNSETGGFLDLASKTALELRDSNLSANVTILSGDSFNREAELSSNIEALSGITITSSQTGGFLDLASETALELRDTELSNNVATLSGNTLQTSDTGQFVSDAEVQSLSGDLHETGINSWNRESELSSNIEALSGVVVFASDTGTLLDSANLTDLEARDLELSNNVATLSGNTVFNSETGGFLDLSSQIALELRDSSLSANVASLSGDLEARDTELSNNVASLSGTVVFAVDTGTLLDSANLTDLEARDLELSNNLATLSGNTVLSSQTGGFLDLASQTDLEARDLELSNNVATLSGNTVLSSQTGGFLDLASQTALELRDTNLSNNVATLSGDLGNYYLNSNPSGFTTGVGVQNTLLIADGTTLTKGEIVLSTGDATVSAIVTELEGKDNLTFQFLGKNYDLPSGANIQLPLGVSAANPSFVYLYATPSGANGVSLNTSTTFPTNSSGFNVIVTYVMPDFDTFRDSGPYLVQRWTDAVEHDNRGILSYEREKFRNLPPDFYNGILPSIEFTSNTGIQVNTLSGVVYQIHRQVFPEFSGTVDRKYYIGNADGASLYSSVSDLSEILSQKDGTPLTNNNRYNLVIWGAINKTEDSCKLFVNLPSDVYSSDSEANSDPNKTADTTVPIDLRSVGFLIARVTLRLDTTPSNTWVNIHPNSSIYDLRGLVPGYNHGAASAGSQTEFSDSVFSVYQSNDSNIAATFDLGNLTTNRIISGADENVDLSLININQSQIISLSGNISTNLGTTGETLWVRDEGLSFNLATLSGDVVFSSETGGFLDLASQTALELRDFNLSSNVASISGLVGGYQVIDTWTGLETITDTYNNYYVNLNGGTVVDMPLPNGLTSGFSFTAWNRGTGTWTFSGVTTLIDLNDVDITTYAIEEKELVTFLHKGSNVWQVIAQNTGGFLTSSDTGNFLDSLDQTNLEARDTEVSNNVATLSGNTVFNSETGGFLDLTSQTALELRDSNLSANVATISGNSLSRDNELSNNIAALSGITITSSQTGGFLDLASETALELRDTNLSANVAALSGNVVATSDSGDFLATSDSGNIGLGFYRTTWVDAGAMVGRTTNGAESVTEEYATNDVMSDHFLFDGVTEEGVQFRWAMPDEWDLSIIKAKVFWDAAAGASVSDGVTWGVSATALSHDDTIDGAFPTSIDIDATVTGVGQLHTTSGSAAITVGGTPALGDLILWEITRVVGDSNDDMTEDAKLLGVQIQYKESDTKPELW